MKRKEKTLLALVGAGVVAIIIVPIVITVLGGFLATYRESSIPIPSSNPLVVSERAKWQEYSDQTNGFKVSYPPELYPAETPLDGYHATFLVADLKDYGVPQDLQPRIQIYKSDLPINEFVAGANENRNQEQFPEYSLIELSPYEAYQTKALDSEVIFSHTVIGTDEVSYLIEMFTIEKENDALKKMYEEMLKSFEILDNE